MSAFEIKALFIMSFFNPSQQAPYLPPVGTYPPAGRMMPTAPAPDSTSANNNPTGQQPLLYPNGYAGNYSGIYPGMPATPPVSPNGFQMPNADYGTMTHQLIEHMPGEDRKSVV